MNLDPQTAEQLLTSLLQPWHASLADPAGTQEQVLHRLLQEYARTDYGKSHGAGNIDTLQDYRRSSSPSASYDDYKPLIDRLMAGDTQTLLCEDPIGWAITRGTTQGEIPSLFP